VSDEIVDELLAAIEPFETVCIGLSNRTGRSGAVYGPVTEQIAKHASGNVVLIRGT
jgi:nucleotide-binding universal stress UspA family protein